MTLTFKKIATAALTLATLGGVLISVGTEQARSNYDIQAAYSENITIYLDKTTTIAGLGWWSTDSTYIHIWNGTDTYQQMTKVNNNIFTYVITTSVWASFTGDGYGIEFYVYDRSSNKNQTQFVGGLSLKNNEHNYIKLTSAFGDAKQTFTTYNKEVEETKTAIVGLSCSSSTSEVNVVVSQYEALRTVGKQVIQNSLIPTDTETYYSRLAYLAQEVGANTPSL